MNIPEIYLVEPYNAYTAQKGGRKKHWHEIIEEQALLQRIMAEQIALQEAASKTLPPNAPNISTPTISGTPQAGAGFVPPPQLFSPSNDTALFSRTPSTASGPVTVQFTNLTPNQYLYNFLWNFGDGTTSTDANPSHVYQSGSSPTNIFTASLQITNSIGGVGNTSVPVYISSSKPTVTAGFNLVSSSVSASSTFTFTNTTVNTSQTPTTTYLWLFGSASLTSTNANPTFTYATSGQYTASLQATGSYGISSLVTRSFSLA